MKTDYCLAVDVGEDLVADIDMILTGAQDQLRRFPRDLVGVERLSFGILRLEAVTGAPEEDLDGGQTGGQGELRAGARDVLEGFFVAAGGNFETNQRDGVEVLLHYGVVRDDDFVFQRRKAGFELPREQADPEVRNGLDRVFGAPGIQTGQAFPEVGMLLPLVFQEFRSDRALHIEMILVERNVDVVGMASAERKERVRTEDEIGMIQRQEVALLGQEVVILYPEGIALDEAAEVAEDDISAVFANPIAQRAIRGVEHVTPEHEFGGLFAQASDHPSAGKPELGVTPERRERHDFLGKGLLQFFKRFNHGAPLLHLFETTCQLRVREATFQSCRNLQLRER